MKAVLCNQVSDLNNGIASLYLFLVSTVWPSEVGIVACQFLFSWLCDHKYQYLALLVPLPQFTQLRIVMGFIQIPYFATKTVAKKKKGGGNFNNLHQIS